MTESDIIKYVKAELSKGRSPNLLVICDLDFLEQWSIPLIKIDEEIIYNQFARIIEKDSERVRFVIQRNDAVEFRTLHKENIVMEPERVPDDEVGFYQGLYDNSDI